MMVAQDTNLDLVAVSALHMEPSFPTDSLDFLCINQILPDLYKMNTMVQPGTRQVKVNSTSIMTPKPKDIPRMDFLKTSNTSRWPKWPKPVNPVAVVPKCMPKIHRTNGMSIPLHILKQKACRATHPRTL